MLANLHGRLTKREVLRSVQISFNSKSREEDVQSFVIYFTKINFMKQTEVKLTGHSPWRLIPFRDSPSEEGMRLVFLTTVSKTYWSIDLYFGMFCLALHTCGQRGSNVNMHNPRWVTKVLQQNTCLHGNRI